MSELKMNEFNVDSLVQESDVRTTVGRMWGGAIATVDQIWNNQEATHIKICTGTLKKTRVYNRRLTDSFVDLAGRWIRDIIWPWSPTDRSEC